MKSHQVAPALDAVAKAGAILASQFGAGQPTEGVGWELFAIASVVVGGTLNRLFTHTDPVRYFALLDETGQYGADIDRALAARRQEASLASLTDWARGNVVQVDGNRVFKP